jgi:hypothetical protein
MGPTTAPVIQALLADSGSSADVGDAACALVLAGVFQRSAGARGFHIVNFASSYDLQAHKVAGRYSGFCSEFLDD